jgi:hypothetical protein
MKDVIRAVIVMASAVALAAVIAGCGAREEEQTADNAPESQEAASESAAPAEAKSRQVCHIKVTSPEMKESHEVRTYWNDASVQAGGGNESFAKSIHWGDEKVKETMSRDPIALTLNCTSREKPEVIVAFQAMGSKMTDIPLGAGTYAIVQNTGDFKPGTFISLGLFYNDVMFEAKGGSIKLDRLDMNGVAGSFTVDGAEHPNIGTRTIHIEGTFDIPCAGGSLEMLCTAPERRRY